MDIIRNKLYVRKYSNLNLQWCKKWKGLDKSLVHFPFFSIVFYNNPSECQSILKSQIYQLFFLNRK